MHARTTTLDLDPSRIDDAVRQLESEDVPTFKEIDGFKGFTLLGDRSAGKVIGVSFWESEEKMQASEEAVKESRQRAAETGGATGSPAVEHYEVLLDVMV
jgi:heme-degrading monooxygenase HmoA